MHRIDQMGGAAAGSTDADALSGSVLDPMPSNGVLRFYIASAVNTCLVSVTPAKHASPSGASAQMVVMSANAEVRDYHPYFETEVSDGEKVIIGVSGTTGIYRWWAQFFGAG